MNKKDYYSPSVEVVEVEIEKGFATSAGSTSVSLPGMTDATKSF